MKVTPVIALLLVGILTKCCCYGAPAKVDKSEENEWLYYMLPLPHSISIQAKNVVSPADLVIKCRSFAGELETNSVKILEEFFKDKTGITPHGNKVEILIGVIDKDGKVAGQPVKGVEKLKSLPNNDQAYLIEPSGDNRTKGRHCAGNIKVSELQRSLFLSW